jgi:hypothetical protein
MPMTRKNVRPVEIDYVCDKCGQGKMRSYANLMSNPVQFRHRCTNWCNGCDFELTRTFKYPYVEYEVVNDFD